MAFNGRAEPGFAGWKPATRLIRAEALLESLTVENDHDTTWQPDFNVAGNGFTA